ncbi:MAG: SlyX family protein [Gallionellaceae bacterium]
MTDQRLEKIEIKLSFQEDLVEELNKTVYQQQQKIERLEVMCQSLAQHVQSLSAARNEEGGMITNERPPHY